MVSTPCEMMSTCGEKKVGIVSIVMPPLASMMMCGQRALVKFDYTGDRELYALNLVRSWLCDTGVADLSAALGTLRASEMASEARADSVDVTQA